MKSMKEMDWGNLRTKLFAMGIVGVTGIDNEMMIGGMPSKNEQS